MCRIARSCLALLILSSPAIPQVVNPANGHTYFIPAKQRNWSAARNFAALNGASLVSVGDAAERDWLIDQVILPTMEQWESVGNSVWIGLSDETVEGTFIWESGEPLLFEDWGQGYPHPPPEGDASDFVAMYEGMNDEWQWVDLPPSSTVLAAFEYASPPTPAVAALDSTGTIGAVEFTWQNPVSFETIEIYRWGALVVTLPGTATEHSLPEPALDIQEYWVIGRITGTPSVPAVIFDAAATPGYTFSIPAATMAVGEPGEARILFSSTLAASTMVYSVFHDPNALELISVGPGSSIGEHLEFLNVVLAADRFGVLLIPIDLGGPLLPPGTSYEFGVATYEPLLPAGSETSLSFCALPVYPEFPTMVVTSPGIYVIPQTLSGIVSIRERRFIRADANADFAVDVADVVFLGAYLFGSGAAPPCRAASDSNGDLAVDVADMVFALSYLFSGGASPDAPFPACGPEPAPSLDCSVPLICP